MRKNELINRLQQIKDMGFVKSLRKGPTGVGYTLEQLLGVNENNIPIPDIGGRLEIKATRRGSNSLNIKENGQVRNRGTAFRVYEESLLTLFAKREQVLQQQKHEWFPKFAFQLTIAKTKNVVYNRIN